MTEVKIKKLKKTDLKILKTHWKVEEPFLERYNSMEKGESTFFIVWLNEKPRGHGRIWWKESPIIGDMDIDNEFRNKKIGEVLLKKLEIVVKEKNFNKIKLYIEEENNQVENFYLRQNYIFTNNLVNCEREMIKELK